MGQVFFCCSVANLLSVKDMPMQMLGVLVCTEIGQHPAGSVSGDDLLRDDFDDIDQFEKQIRVAFRKRQEGGDQETCSARSIESLVNHSR